MQVGAALLWFSPWRHQQEHTNYLQPHHGLSHLENASKCSREPDRLRKKQDTQGLVTFHSGIITPNSPGWLAS